MFLSFREFSADQRISFLDVVFDLRMGESRVAAHQENIQSLPARPAWAGSYTVCRYNYVSDHAQVAWYILKEIKEPFRF